MRGWFKLRETILQEDPHSDASSPSTVNSDSTDDSLHSVSSSAQDEALSPVETTTNGHILESPRANHITYTLDSPENIFDAPAIINLHDAPRVTLHDRSPVQNISGSPGKVDFRAGRSS